MCMLFYDKFQVPYLISKHQYWILNWVTFSIEHEICGDKVLNTTPTPYKFEKNEELISQLTVTQNTLKVLQEAFNTASSKLVELERKHHKLVQHSRRKCLKFSDIPSSVAPKDLKNFPICLFQEIGIDLDKSWLS